MDNNISDPSWISILLAALTGVLGRVMFMTQSGRNPFSVALLWELPTAVAMGWIGAGIGEYAGLNGFALFALPIVVSYVGPGLISFLVKKYFDFPPSK